MRFADDPEYNPIDTQYDWDVTLRAMNKFLCGSMLLTLFIYFIIMRICFKRKIYEIFSNVIETSIFSFLDDLQLGEAHKENTQISFITENISLHSHKTLSDSPSIADYDMKEMKLLSKGIKAEMEKMQERSDIKDGNQEKYICNIYDCCCLCCCTCWLDRVFNDYIGPCIYSIQYTTSTVFRRNLKSFCFYLLTLGSFIYNPLRDLLSMIFNECVKENMNAYIYEFLNILFVMVDLIFGALMVVLFIFINSFLNTKKELLKISFFDKTYRARLIYFHLNKALILGFLYTALKIAYKTAFLFQFPCYEMLEGSHSAMFMLFKAIFLMSMVKFNTSMSSSSIQQDCCILKAHARYFTIQNNLLKRMPKACDIYKIIKKEAMDQIDQSNHLSINQDMMMMKEHKVDIGVIEKRIIKRCNRMKIQLIQELSIINTQKFKNILRNHGYLRYLPIFFIVFFTISMVLTIILSVLLLIKLSFSEQEQGLVSFTFAKMGSSVLTFIECSVLPIFIYLCIKKSTICQSKIK